jgi:predicted transglutaminase-like cysteine proteinase
VRGFLLVLALAAGLAQTARILADYPEWDFDRITQNAERQNGHLGMRARDKISSWEAMLNESEGLEDRQKLEVVNRFFNRQFIFVDDIRTWAQVDYWATPLEATIKGAGDCEDYSIAKYFTLRRLGIPSSKLRITYVKALELNQAHMVLTYYATPTSEPLVLDNLINDIRPASKRRDLLPVYAFNAEGLFVSNTRKGDSKRLSRWQDLLKKMRAEGFAVGEG